MSEQVIRISIEVPVSDRWPNYYPERQHELLREATDQAVAALRAAVEATKGETHE